MALNAEGEPYPGPACGKCYKATISSDCALASNLCDHNANRKVAGRTIILKISDSCPYATNKEHCPKLGMESDVHMGYNLDVLIPGAGGWEWGSHCFK